MIIPTLFSGSGAQAPMAPVALMGPADPTQDPNAMLSVKEYVLSNGVKVWASYQCPSCNEAIKSLQVRLNNFAALAKKPAVAVDGLIGDSTLALARAVADFALTKQVFIQGGMLKVVAATAKMLAQKAHVAADLVQQIGNVLGIDTSQTVVTPAPPKPSRPRAPAGGGLPEDVILPDFSPAQHASPGIFSKHHWSWYVAGGILLLGLSAATYFVWKKD